MTKSAKAAVAEVTETLAAQALIERGPPAVKARGGKTRMLHIVGPDGKPTGKLATHGQVLAGVAKAAEIVLAVQDGKLPSVILCSTCKVPVQRKTVVPKYCKKCADDRRKRREGERSKRRWGHYSKKEKLAQTLARHARRQASGLCRCGKTPKPGTKVCERCSEKGKERNRRLRAKAKAGATPREHP